MFKILIFLISVPNWFHTHMHPSYPSDLYIIGVGWGTSLEEAKLKALVDIGKQIEVTVKSEEEIITIWKKYSSQIVDPYTEIVSKLKEEVKPISLKNIKWAETIYEEGNYYVMAVLDKRVYSRILVNEIMDALSKIDNLIISAKDYENSGNVIIALKCLDRALDLLYSMRAKYSILMILRPYDLPQLDDITKEIEITNKITGLIQGLNLEIVYSDSKLKVRRNEELKLTVRFTYEDKPLYPVKIKFVYEDGEIAGESYTDKDGIAVIRFLPSTTSHFIEIFPDVNFSIIKGMLDVYDIRIKCKYVVMSGGFITLKTFLPIESKIKNILTEGGYEIAKNARCVLKIELYKAKEKLFERTIEVGVKVEVYDRKRRLTIAEFDYESYGTGRYREAYYEALNDIAEQMQLNLLSKLDNVFSRYLLKEPDFLYERFSLLKGWYKSE